MSGDGKSDKLIRALYIKLVNPAGNHMELIFCLEQAQVSKRTHSEHAVFLLRQFTR